MTDMTEVPRDSTEGALPDTAPGCVVAQVECPVVVPRTRTTSGCGVVVLCDGSPDPAVDDCLMRADRSADPLVAGPSHAHRVDELVLGSTTSETIECVTAVLPEDARTCLEISDPRIVVARLHGAAHRLTMIDVSPDQAVRELLSITRDHGLIAEAAVSALRGWGSGATKAWQTAEVAELLIWAATETSTSDAERLSRARDERRREAS